MYGYFWEFSVALYGGKVERNVGMLCKGLKGAGSENKVRDYHADPPGTNSLASALK